MVILWIGGKGVARGNIQIGSMIGAIGYSAQILFGFAMLTSVILAIPRGQTSSKRINEVLETPLTITDPETPTQDWKELSLTFEEVDFKYSREDKKALSGICLSVHAGQFLQKPQDISQTTKRLMSYMKNSLRTALNSHSIKNITSSDINIIQIN